MPHDYITLMSIDLEEYLRATNHLKYIFVTLRMTWTDASSTLDREHWRAIKFGLKMGWVTEMRSGTTAAGYEVVRSLNYCLTDKGKKFFGL